MKADIAWASPPLIYISFAADQVPPGVGEDSTEAQYQAKRQQGIVSCLPLLFLWVLLVKTMVSQACVFESFLYCCCAMLCLL